MAINSSRCATESMRRTSRELGRNYDHCAHPNNDSNACVLCKHAALLRLPAYFQALKWQDPTHAQFHINKTRSSRIIVELLFEWFIARRGALHKSACSPGSPRLGTSVFREVDLPGS